MHGKLEKTTDEDDDDVLVMDETGAFVAVTGPLPAIKNEIDNVVCTQLDQLLLLSTKPSRL